MQKFSNIKVLLTKPAAWAGFVLIVVIVVVIVELALSLSDAKQSANQILNLQEKQNSPSLNWENAEIREIFKHKLWLETQLELSKEDSMSLGINLSDSIVQIQMKGLPLIQSKILYMRPENFLSEINAASYASIFGQPVSILNGTSNLSKKPIRKMKVIEGSDAEPVKSDSIVTKRFYWEFVADNNLRIVINGCETSPDSTLIVPSFTADMIKFRLKGKSQDLNNQNYHPVLFIWMNDKEAKAIYRALPENTKLAIRN